jgi:hypothetical protein
MRKKRGRPKGEPRSTRGVNLPVRYWLWLKTQPIPARQVILNLIKQEMLRQKDLDK